MTSFDLMSKADTLDHVANLFVSEARFSKCKIEVSEEHVFYKKALVVGEISLQTSKSIKEVTAASLISHGAFEWKVPTDVDMTGELNDLLETSKNGSGETAREVLRNLTKVAARSGILNPTFDPLDIEDMPLMGSTTVVADTSGVLSGALDFIVRHFPSARIKVPAIVHMEIVNMRDRFRTIRKKLMNRPEGRKNNIAKIRNKLLLDRLKAEGGARALLRLELQAPTEVERTYLLGDPLRSAFEHDRQDGLRELDIRKPQREYADRLILESARHHQAQSGPNHAVRLLTSDQLLASMALAEGVHPMFIRDFQNDDFFGQRFSGQTFDPFGGYLRRTSLLAILWELTFSFGEVRIKSDDCRCVTLRAFDAKCPWSTYHVMDDLLWCHASALDNRFNRIVTNSEDLSGKTGTRKEEQHEVENDTPAAAVESSERVAFQKFDVNKLIELIFLLDDSQELSLKNVMAVLRTSSMRGSIEYRRFLRSAGLASVDDVKWSATDRLTKLSAALRNERISDLRELLSYSPSFKRFRHVVNVTSVGSVISTVHFQRAAKTYTVLGEISHIVASVGNTGVFPTPTLPDTHSFARIALERFSELDDGDGLVSAGKWLESLVRINGIHPEIARLRLSAASEEGSLFRSTEGSTAQLRNSNHNIHVLRIVNGIPKVRRINLYRGDYLVEGKGSVSLRIKDAES